MIIYTDILVISHYWLNILVTQYVPNMKCITFWNSSILKMSEMCSYIIFPVVFCRTTPLKQGYLAGSKSSCIFMRIIVKVSSVVLKQYFHWTLNIRLNMLWTKCSSHLVIDSRTRYASETTISLSLQLQIPQRKWFVHFEEHIQ